MQEHFVVALLDILLPDEIQRVPQGRDRRLERGLDVLPLQPQAVDLALQKVERSGLVAKVVPAAELVDEALKTAETIASMAPLAAIATKEMINAAFEMGLAQGINFERRLFHGLFGTEDQKEGMSAFVEKRPGNWTGR